MKKKLFKLLPALLILSLLLVACGQEADEGEVANEMKYVGIEDLKESIESEADDYVILDVRKAEDFDKSHIVGSFGADLDAAKNGDNESGIKNLKEALKLATGEELGNPDDKYALICYSGKSYAQKGTDLMIEMGISADQIYTLEGGIGAWEKAGEEYKELLEK